jgi:hypothetical protein
MAYVTYDKIRAYFTNADAVSGNAGSDNILYATSLSASNTTSLKRIKRIGQEIDYYIQTGPKSSSVSANVLLIESGILQITNLTGDSTIGSIISVPDYQFKKCFLKSFFMSLEPWKVASAALQFDSYGLANGSGIYAHAEQQASSQTLLSPLRATTIQFTAPNFSHTPISQYENISFDIQVDRVPNFVIGSEYPEKVSVSKVTKSLQVNGLCNADWLSDYQPNTTVTCTITMSDATVFSVAGVLSNQTFSVDSNGVAKGGLQIIEEMV